MSCGKGRTIVRDSRTEIVSRMIDYLRALYPVKMTDHVAGDLHVSPRAVEKWLSRESAPSLPTFGVMALVYGPAFVSRVFPSLTWLDPVVRQEKTATLLNEIAERERQLADLARD